MFSGLFLAIGQLGDPRIRRTSSFADIAILVLLWYQVGWATFVGLGIMLLLVTGRCPCCSCGAGA